jgi:SulP family sulfate permease
VVTGFTAGIAVSIFVSQIKDLLGLSVSLPGDFIPKVTALGAALPQTNFAAVAVALLSLVVIVVLRIVRPKWPGFLVALILGGGAAVVLGLNVPTIGSAFGGIPRSLPAPTLPPIDIAKVREVLPDAFTIALLAGIESLLSAVVADGMTGRRHRSNVELIAQGVANLGSALFAGLPATGAIARTATNIKSGARTPVAGMVHALTLLLITLFFGRWAELIPLAVLAAIVLLVAYRLSEWRVFLHELRAPRSDALVMVATFLLTLLVDLTVGIGVGMVLAAFLFMKRMAEVTNITVVRQEFEESGTSSSDERGAIYRRRIPPGVEVYEINGPFFFGAAEKFKDTLSEVSRKPKVLIVRMRNVPAIDSTAMHALKDLVRRTRRQGTHVLLSDVHSQPLVALERAGLLEEIGEDNLFGDVDAALDAARNRVQSDR